MKFIIFITICVLNYVSCYKFPDNFERCHKSDPKLDDCLVKSIQNAIQVIGASGIPSLHLPPIDPLAVERIEIGAGTNAVHFVQKYFDVKVTGFSKTNIENAHLDLDKKVLTFEMNVPKIQHLGKYDMKGKIMVMPFFGKGDSTLALFDVMLRNTITFEKETKNGGLYFKIKSYKLSIEPKGAHYQFDNLFDGDEQLASNILKVLNDNWKEIFDDVKGGLEGVYSEIFMGIANGLFGNVPAEEVLLN